MGKIAIKQGKYDDAERLFQESLSQDKHNYDATLGILSLLIYKKNLDQALNIRNLLLKRNPYNKELKVLNDELGKKLGEGK